MGQFKTNQESHDHAMNILMDIYDHDDFLESIDSVIDVGCGEGDEILWWATLETRDEVPVPHDYRCIGIDKDVKQFRHPKPQNLHVLEGDFTTSKISRKVDMVWAHNSLQFTENPAATLRHWNEYLNDGGVLCVTVPQTVNIENNRWVSETRSGQPFSFTISNLIYMLACAGFDCKDGLFKKKANDPWITAFVYKSEHAPVSTTETNWYELMEKELLPDSADDAVKKRGMLHQHDLMTRWLDNDIIIWSRV
jgi:SAM-dependent methyltransferase